MTNNPTFEEKIEETAKEIYAAWSSQKGFKPWAEGGNSVKQNHARDIARRQLAEAVNGKK